MARSGGSSYGNDVGQSEEVLARAREASAAAAKANGQPGHRKEVRELARSLLTPEYRENLKLRLLAGVAAPAVEVMVWRYAFGEPLRSGEDDVDARQQMFEEMRISVRRTLRSKKARVLDAKVQGARRLLGDIAAKAPDPAGEVIDVVPVEEADAGG